MPGGGKTELSSREFSESSCPKSSMIQIIHPRGKQAKSVLLDGSIFSWKNCSREEFAPHESQPLPSPLSLPRVGFGLPASLMHELCLTRLKSSSHSNVIDEFGVIHCLERECRSQACNRRWRCHSISP